MKCALSPANRTLPPVLVTLFLAATLISCGVLSGETGNAPGTHIGNATGLTAGEETPGGRAVAPGDSVHGGTEEAEGAWALPAAVQLEMDVVWQEGGLALDMAVESATLVLARGPRLSVYDVGDPSGARLVGRSEILADMVGAVALAGSRLVAGAGGVPMVFDLADPARPSLLLALDCMPHRIVDIAATESTAFVLSSPFAGEGLVRALAVSAPEPEVASEMQLPGPAQHLCLDGARLYAVVGGEAADPAAAGVYMIDVSQPSAPAAPTLVYKSANVRYVAASAGILFVSESRRFAILDAADPGDVIERGWLPVETPAGPVRIDGSRAYLVAGGALRIIDIANPSLPRQLGYHPVRQTARDLELGADRAFVLEEVEWFPATRLRSFQVAGRTEPAEVGGPSMVAGASRVELEGDRLYVTADGLRVYDVADPAAPRLASHVSPEKLFDGIDVRDGIGLLLGGELLVVDVAVPDAPRVWARLGAYVDQSGSTHTIGRPVARLALEGTQALVSDGNRVRLIDLADPTAPVVVSALPPQDGYPGVGEDLTHPGDVAFCGSHAIATFNGDGGRQLASIDIIPPTQPLIAARLRAPEPYSAEGLECVGELCFVTTRGAGVWIVDMADPEDPLTLGALAGRGRAEGYGIEVRGDTAYVSLLPYVDVGSPSFGGGGIRVVDVSNRDAPAEVGILRTPGYPYDIAIGEGYAYVADGPAGLLVVRTSGSSVK